MLMIGFHVRTNIDELVNLLNYAPIKTWIDELLHILKFMNYERIVELCLKLLTHLDLTEFAMDHQLIIWNNTKNIFEESAGKSDFGITAKTYYNEPEMRRTNLTDIALLESNLSQLFEGVDVKSDCTIWTLQNIGANRKHRVFRELMMDASMTLPEWQDIHISWGVTNDALVESTSASHNVDNMVPNASENSNLDTNLSQNNNNNMGEYINEDIGSNSNENIGKNINVNNGVQIDENIGANMNDNDNNNEIQTEKDMNPPAKKKHRNNKGEVTEPEPRQSSKLPKSPTR